MTLISLLFLSLQQAGRAARPAPSGNFMVAGIPFLILLILLVPYFLPTIIAFVRKHQNAAPILLLNLFLGWTLIGWIASLIWALSSPQVGANVNIYNVPSSASTLINFCSQCGAKTGPSDSFCSGCGAKIK